MTRVRSLAAGVVLLAARIAAADPLPEKSFGLPLDVSRDGHHIDTLLWFTLAAIVVIYVLVAGGMFWAFARHGKKHPAAHDGGTRRSIGVLVGAIAVIALLVDGPLFARTLFDMNDVFWNFSDVDRKPDVVRLEVNAHQWAWLARYPGPDGKFNTEDDIVTTNDIRIPVGVPILIQIASNDVIHSFYLPNFRVKRDAVPGMVNGLWFQAEKTGQYEIACAQHCGPNHYKMRGILTVLPPDRYRAWLAEAEAMARRGYDPEDRDGQWGWDWRKE